MINHSIKLDELYPEKKKLLKQIQLYFTQNRMGYINVPTGWGKTFLALYLIREYLNQGKQVLYLVYKNNPLLIQTYNDKNNLEPLFPRSLALSSDFNLNDLNVNALKNNNVIFASLDTLIGDKRSNILNFLCSNLDLVVIDEIHNFIKNRGNEFIKMLPNSTKIFGMTATPFQGVIGKQKYVSQISNDIKEIFRKSISKCIIDGDLSPITYSIIRNDTNIDDIFNFDSNLIKKGLVFKFNVLNLIIERTRLAKQIYDEKVLPNSKTLIFCAPVQNIPDCEKKVGSLHAKICASIFNEEDLKTFDNFKNRNDAGSFKTAVFLSSELGNIEKKKIIQSFKRPNIAPFVVCTVGMLTEGFNFRKLNNLFLLRPTFSMRLFEQQIGRVTRNHPEKDRGNIFEIVDNLNVKSLHDKFSDIFSKEFSKLQLLDPENRIQKLFFQERDEIIEILERKLIQIQEIQPRFSAKLKDKNLSYVESIRNLHYLDYRVKLIKNLIDRINSERSTNFKKEKIILLMSISKINIFSVEDFELIFTLISQIKESSTLIKNDSHLSTEEFIAKESSFNEILWYLKLVVLVEIEKYPDIFEKNKTDFYSQLDINNFRRIDELKEICVRNGTNSNIEEIYNTISNLKRLKGDLLKQAINSFRIEVIFWLATFNSMEFSDFVEKEFKSEIFLKHFRIIKKTYCNL